MGTPVSGGFCMAPSPAGFSITPFVNGPGSWAPLVECTPGNPCITPGLETLCVTPIQRMQLQPLSKWQSEVAAELHEQIARQAKEIAALKSMVYHSRPENSRRGLEGLMKRAGRPVEKESIKKVRRLAAAATMVEVCKMIQGPDLASNTIAFVAAATCEDPSVPQRLIAAGVFPERLVIVPDKRTQTQFRVKAVGTLVPKNNAFLWQATNTVTNKAVKGLRQLGGKLLMDTPEELQKWAAQQPELPDFRFAMAGSCAVWTPPTTLLQKLLENDRIVESLRWEAPYEKLKEGNRIFVVYLVSYDLASLYACCQQAARKWYDLFAGGRNEPEVQDWTSHFSRRNRFRATTNCTFGNNRRATIAVPKRERQVCSFNRKDQRECN